MSDHSNRKGKRVAGGQPSALSLYWARYRDWVAGLTRGQRVRYRLLQAAVIISLAIIVGFCALRAWIRVPDLPGGNGGLGGNGAGLAFEDSEAPDAARGQREGVYTFLLAGRDTAGGGNTDTMLLLTYDTNEKTIHGLNLPRDTMVNVSTSSKRLNAVYNYNKGKDKAVQAEKGMAALKKEVANLTGITPNFYVVVEWEAIGELVDALGGVEFEVPFDMDYDDPTPGQELHIHQKAGLRVLSGDDAMQVIRHRKNNDGSHSNGDVGRLKIQQDFLKAVAKKCLQPATFLKVPALAEIFTKNVTTDLTVGNILALAELAYGMDPDEDVSFVTAPIGASFKYRGAALVTLDETKLLEILNDTMNPYDEDIEASDLQLVYRKSDGSFGVTNGTLADPEMGRGSGATQSKPQPSKPEEPDVQPEDPEVPDDGAQGEDEVIPPDSSTGEVVPPDGSQPETGDGSAPSQGGEDQSSQSGGGLGSIDPDEVLPDPSGGANDSDPVTVLPGGPEPGELAA